MSDEEARPDQAAEAQADAERREHVKRVVEALLFSSDRPLRTGVLAQIADARDGNEVRSVAKELRDEYEEQRRAFAVEEVAGGLQLLTRPDYAQYVRRLGASQQQDSLSSAALETLAIVAYRQPVTRAEVEDIRGVGCGSMLRSLVEKRLLRVMGRSDELGRPLLYGTTRRFLEAFGLNSLSDLPRKTELGHSDTAADR